jgi:hypothetical protein
MDTVMDLNLIAGWDMHLAGLPTITSAEVFRFVQFASGASASLDTTDSGSGAERTPNQRPLLGEETIDLPLVPFGSLRKSLTNSAGVLWHADKIS